jgi:hypothetical protein
VPAAIALLDRGWGRPKQVLENADPASPILLHLLAAQHVSQELTAALERRDQRTINGHAEPSSGKIEPAATAQDLLMQPPPLE